MTPLLKPSCILLILIAKTTFATPKPYQPLSHKHSNNIIVSAPKNSFELRKQNALVSNRDIAKLIVNFKFFKNKLFAHGKLSLNNESCQDLAEMVRLFYDELNLAAKKRIPVSQDLKCMIGSGQLVKSKLEENTYLKFFQKYSLQDQNKEIERFLIRENTFGRITATEMAMVLQSTLVTQRGLLDQTNTLIEKLIENPFLGLTFIAFIDQYSKQILGRDLSDIYKHTGKVESIIESLLDKLIDLIPFIHKKEQALTTTAIVQFFFDIRSYIETKSENYKETIALATSEEEFRKLSVAFAANLNKAKANAIVSLLEELPSSENKLHTLTFAAESITANNLSPEEVISIVTLLERDQRPEALKLLVGYLDPRTINNTSVHEILTKIGEFESDRPTFFSILFQEFPERIVENGAYIASQNFEPDFVLGFFEQRLSEVELSIVEFKELLSYGNKLEAGNQSRFEAMLIRWAAISLSRPKLIDRFLVIYYPEIVNTKQKSLLSPIAQLIATTEQLNSLKLLLGFTEKSFSLELARIFAYRIENGGLSLDTSSLATLAAYTLMTPGSEEEKVRLARYFFESAKLDSSIILQSYCDEIDALVPISKIGPGIFAELFLMKIEDKPELVSVNAFKGFMEGALDRSKKSERNRKAYGCSYSITTELLPHLKSYNL